MSGQPTFEEKQYVLKLSRPIAEVAKDQKMTEDELRHKLAVACEPNSSKSAKSVRDRSSIPRYSPLGTAR